MRYQAMGSIAVAVLVFVYPARAATISASGDTSMPSTTTNYSLTGTPSSASVSIIENVIDDAASGPWHKMVANGTNGAISSGQDVSLLETFTNAGLTPWTGWHEEVVTRTTINHPNDSTDYLFHQGTLSVQADYGAGLVGLTQGVDYTLTTVPYSGPSDPGGNDNGWEALTINLSPTKQILTGDKLVVNKSMFEVFLNGDIWHVDQNAELAQYPTVVPEPGSLGLLALAGLGVFGRWFGRRR